MSKAEEYLDSLLNNVSPARKAEKAQERRNREINFGDDFDNEIDDADLDDFIRDFEDEIDVGEPAAAQGSDDSFFDNLEGIVHNAKETVMPENDSDRPSEPLQTGAESAGAFEINTLDDDSWTEGQQEQQTGAADMSDDAKELMDLLAGLPSEEELADIQNFAAAGYDTQEDPGVEDEESHEEVKEKKIGLFQKIAAFFSKRGKKGQEKEEDGLDLDEPGMSMADADIEGMSDENLQILQELDAAEQAGKTSGGSKKEKGKKKKEKKEKGDKKAKEKKPKKEKKKKEKKPKEKKPKQVDLSPPLPKKPVILIFVMGFSVLFLVLLTTNLFGYSASMAEAKEAYAAQDYIAAYQKLSGLKAKEDDEEFCRQIYLLAAVQEELFSGDALYRLGEYRKALDSYIRALGRYDRNYMEAADLHLDSEYVFLAEQIQGRLADQFGVSPETAREIYGLSDRKEYTCRIYDIVKALGLVAAE